MLGQLLIGGRNLLHVPERIVNQRTNDVLFEEVFRAKGVGQRAKGLLGTESLPPGRALLIEPARQVHTVGMKFSIDVLFCGPEMQVVRVVRNLAPNRLTAIHWRARRVIECAAGDAGDVQVGDVLEIQPIER